MDNAKVIGRVGALAIALGIAVGMAATPWAAAAKPASSDTSNASKSSTAPGQNMSVATNGTVRVQKGSATAESAGQGSVAIAKGVNATAIAGITECGDRCTVAPSHNKAMVKGDNSSALIADGSYNLTWLTFGVLAWPRRVELRFWSRFGWNLNTRVGP